jgi:sec-independent protein translocase protein TatA
MFSQIGPMEIALVLVLALLVLGPKRLPEAGRSLGRGIREFKDTLTHASNMPEPAEAPAPEASSDAAQLSPRASAVAIAEPATRPGPS